MFSRIIAAIALLFAVVQPAFAGGSMNAEVRSAYNFPGIQVYSDPFATLSATLPVGDYSFTVWRAVPLQSGKVAAVQETDIAVGRSFKLGDDLTCSGTVTYFAMPGIPDIIDLQPRCDYSFSEFVSVYADYEHLIGLGSEDGHILHLGLAGSIPLTERFSFGWNGEYYDSDFGGGSTHTGIRLHGQLDFRLSEVATVYVAARQFESFTGPTYSPTEFRLGLTLNF